MIVTRSKSLCLEQKQSVSTLTPTTESTTTSNIRQRRRARKPSYRLNETRSKSVDSSISQAIDYSSQRNHQFLNKSLRVILNDIHASRRSKSLCLEKTTEVIEFVDSNKPVGPRSKVAIARKKIPPKENQINNPDPTNGRNLRNKRQVASKKASSKPETEQNSVKHKSSIKEKRLGIKLERLNIQIDSKKVSEAGQSEHNTAQTTNKTKENQRQVVTQNKPLKIQKKEVTFKPPMACKLRKLEPKTYVDESNTESIIEMTKKPTDAIPVYRKPLPESPKKGTSVAESLCLEQKQSVSRYCKSLCLEQKQSVSTLTPTIESTTTSNIRQRRRARKSSYRLNETRSKSVDSSISQAIDYSSQRNHQFLNKSLRVILNDIHASRRSKSLCLEKTTEVIEFVDSNKPVGPRSKVAIARKKIPPKENQINNPDPTNGKNLRNKRQVASKKASSKPETEQNSVKHKSSIKEKRLGIKLERLNIQIDSKKVSEAGQSEHNTAQTTNKTKENQRQVVTQNKPLKIQKKEVTFKPPMARKLRKLEPKTYVDESNTESIIEMTKKPTDAIPVYRKPLPESPKKGTSVADLYEFVDLSPKKPKVAKNDRRSSVLFDKNIYKTMKNIELKEAKIKKRTVKKSTKSKAKSEGYREIVMNIVKNVAKKIDKKSRIENGKSVTNEVTNKKKEAQCDKTNEKRVPQQIQNGKIVGSATDKEKEQHDIAKEILLNDNEYEIHSPLGLPSRDHTPEPPMPRVSIISNITLRKPDNIRPQVHSTPVTASLTNNITTRRGINKPQEDNVLHIIHSSDNSLTQHDINSCFGFDEDLDSPSSKKINCVKGAAGIDSPANFHYRRPNANSTMCPRPSTPWRPSQNFQRVPHFLSVKGNALPRLDQDMVLDHTIVEEFEKNCSKVERNLTPAKKSPIQTSILDFVTSTDEHQKENMLMRRSLYDIEEFDSPKKLISREGMNTRAVTVKKNLQFHFTAAEVSKMSPSKSPKKRAPLMPLNESPADLDCPVISSSVQSVTYFGFEQTSELITQEGNQENDNSPGKPSRFDFTKLRRSYQRAQKRAKRLKNEENVQVPEEVNNESISIMGGGDEDVNEAEVRLFEEPEEILEQLAQEVQEKKHKRRRRDSCDSDTSETGKKKRKHKKTKFELEQEAWISDFNQACEEIDKDQLEVE